MLFASLVFSVFILQFNVPIAVAKSTVNLIIITKNVIHPTFSNFSKTSLHIHYLEFLIQHRPRPFHLGHMIDFHSNNFQVQKVFVFSNFSQPISFHYPLHGTRRVYNIGTWPFSDFQVRDVQVARMNAEPCSSSAAGFWSHGAGNSAAGWESKVVSSKSPVTAGRGV